MEPFPRYLHSSKEPWQAFWVLTSSPTPLWGYLFLSFQMYTLSLYIGDILFYLHTSDAVLAFSSGLMSVLPDPINSSLGKGEVIFLSPESVVKTSQWILEMKFGFCFLNSSWFFWSHTFVRYLASVGWRPMSTFSQRVLPSVNIFGKWKDLLNLCFTCEKVLFLKTHYLMIFQSKIHCC